MKQAQLVEMVMAGGIVCVGNYLSGRLETVSVRDKANPGGPRRSAYVTKEIIITDTDPIVISRWLNDNEKPEDWKAAHKKGDKVVVKVKGMQLENGIPVLQGVIESLA